MGLPATIAIDAVSSFGRSKGFTLLEVMVAISIFAIMGVASYQLLSGEIRTQQRLQQQASLQNNWQRSMLRLTRDLQQLTSRGVRENYGELEAPLISDGQSLRLTRQGWSNPLGRQRSELQRVQYALKTLDQLPAHEEKTLSSPRYRTIVSRSFWSRLDRAPDAEAIEQSLFIGANDLHFRFFDKNKQQWIVQWPPRDEESSILPQAIEVNLSSDRYGELERLISLTPTTVGMINGGNR